MLRTNKGCKETNRDKGIPGMSININAIESCMDVLDCMTAKEISLATLDNEHLGMMSEYVLLGWPSTKAEVLKELWPYKC